MAYYFNKSLSAPFNNVLVPTIAALKAEEFGIITEIDLQSTMNAPEGGSALRRRKT
jgi:hypothetical protein